MFQYFGLQVWRGTVEWGHQQHRHNEIELNWVESGYMTYNFGGQKIVVAEAEFAMFWAALPHQVIDTLPSTQVCWATIPLHILLDWKLPPHLLQHQLQGQFLKLTAQQIAPYHQRFFEVWSQAFLPPLQANVQQVALDEVRAMLGRISLLDLPTLWQPTPFMAAHTEEKSYAMARFIGEQFREPIQIHDMAAAVGLSPNYALTLFKRVFGLTPNEYLTQRRIAYAQQQLILTELSVLDIALDCGFQSQSSFYEAFKKICGVAPGQYRRRLLPD
ncbi:MAG: helix-turn-helix domain-containing protein [Phototrophicaceae bacterium]